MRAAAPLQILLACTAVALLPARMMARAHAVVVAKRHASSSHAGARHAISRHEAHATHSGKQPRHVRSARPSKEDRATTERVHAWIDSQRHSGQSAKPRPPVSPSVPAKAEAHEADSAATPISVVGTIRTAETVSDKPQLAPVADLAAAPLILPTLYNKRGRLVVPPPLKGSHEILIRQNVMADSDGLDRILDDTDLDRMRRIGSLVAIPAGATLRVDERLPSNRRFCRPWTALFLDTLGRQHYARFGTALQVNSAVRTVEFQQRLIRTNGNAAPAEGDTASPHLTGQAIDIAKHGLSLAEVAWLRGYLLPLVQQGKVDVEEEFQQSCFHISVYKKYMPSPATRREIATTHREGIGVLATGLR